MLSYWEKESFVSYDYIIVGGGIVGFSTSISLKERFPKSSILVLEAGFLPSGASTKNAGFACVGSLSEIVKDLESHTPKEIQDLALLRFDGLNLLRARLGDNNIDYLASSSNELLMEVELPFLDKIKEVNKLLMPIFNKNIFSNNEQNLYKLGFGNKVKGLIKNSIEGSIHTGKMMKSLILKAQSLGIEYKTLSRVESIQDTGKTVRVKIRNFESPLNANKVFVCTNAFSRSLIPDLELEPGRGQVLITKRIVDLKFKGIFHFDGGYYYFREVDGRILFGGGRNIDFEKETTSELELNEKIQQDLEHKLNDVVCPGVAFEIDQRWSGIMAFGRSKKPIVKCVSPNVIAGVRLGGMGIAIGSKMGEMLVQQLEVD